MFKIIQSTKFKKDWKKIKNQKNKFDSALKIITYLQERGTIGVPEKNYPHPLKGGLNGFMECHILPDLLLIWEERTVLREIHLARIGSHSELF